MNQQSQTSQPQKRQLANWITAYATEINQISEPPVAYNTWAAISAVSAVLKNNVWISRGTYKIHPNQFVVLVGPPGIGKGQAMHTAHSFVKNTSSNLALANYIQDRITPQKFIEKLATGYPKVSVNGSGQLAGVLDSTCILQASELASLIGDSGWMSTFLCDAWDRYDYSYDTKMGGQNLIKNMCVSLIGCCVPNFVHNMNKNGSEILNGGFTARTIFVYAKDKHQLIVWPREPDSILVAKLRNDLQMISRLHGEYCFEPGAKVAFEKKYYSVGQNDSDSSVIKDFKARQGTHVLKVAMTLSAAGSDTLVINQWAMDTAILFVDNVLLTLDTCFRGVGDSTLALSLDRIQTYMEQRRMCYKKDIIRDNMRHVHPADLEMVLITLINSGIITEVQSGRDKLYKFVGRPSNTP